MPAVNPEILVWARETAGLTTDEAVRKLGISAARGVSAVDRLTALERGREIPSRPMLVKMAKQYRRPLVAFYLPVPPRKGDRGEDFRTLPADHSPAADVLLDALIRDIRARQNLVRAALEDEEEAETLRFVGSAQITDGVPRVLASIRERIGVDVQQFRAQNSPDEAFVLLRNGVEAAGAFVLLIGDLGSHHTAIDLQTFRGFALADPIAPFVVINDHDARSAWSFTLLHELTHLWLGTTGVSGTWAETRIEQFCNDVAGEFLLPVQELADVDVNDSTDFQTAFQRIGDFAHVRHLSRSMVAYKLHRADRIDFQKWRQLSAAFREQWLLARANQRERTQRDEGGPNYYIVRRHRLGTALLNLVRRTMSAGILTPSKAGKVLGVKPRNVAPLLTQMMPAGRGSAV